jgi:hypothetical protein
MKCVFYRGTHHIVTMDCDYVPLIGDHVRLPNAHGNIYQVVKRLLDIRFNIYEEGHPDANMFYIDVADLEEPE